MVESA
jgi:hypothetical protein